MSETMIERVAGILEPQAWAALGTGDTLAYQNRRTSSLRKARSALKAMLPPTEEMCEAGDECCGEYGCSASRMREIFTAMITAALQEPKP